MKIDIPPLLESTLFPGESQNKTGLDIFFVNLDKMISLEFLDFLPRPNDINLLIEAYAPKVTHTRNASSAGVKNKVKRVIAYGNAANIIKTALGDAVKLKIVFSLKDAVKTCHNHAQPGDVILLSPGCASFDQFKNFEERGKFFKTVVNEMVTA